MKRKVFGIGMPRTGTGSLFEAMKILGYKSEHYIEPEDYPRALRENDFLCDMPICSRFTELKIDFPDALFILTFRNAEDWLSSIEALINSTAYERRAGWPEYKREIFGGEGFNRAHFSEIWDSHYCSVVECLGRSGRFSLFALADQSGEQNWDHLCRFLGEPIPSVEFPHANPRGLMSSRQLESQIVGASIFKNPWRP